jgi:arylsulfatase A-like enzyme
MHANGGRWPSRWSVPLALVLIAVSVAGILHLRRERPPERIVLIVIDTLRRDRLSPYGADVATPNVQALADRGQVFTHALAAFHQTSMSMGALFTGRTPSIESGDPARTLFWNRLSWCGLARFARVGEPATCVPPSLPTLAERLRDAGFWTIGIASNEFLYEPFGYSAGFDDWVEVGQRPDLPTVRQLPGSEGAPWEWKLVRWPFVNRAAVDALNRRPHDHFFLYVHYMDVHDYHFEDRPYDEAVEAVDAAVGRLLHQLEAGGLLNGAVVFLTSDHGERLDESRSMPSAPRHAGNPSFQELLRVPLIVAPPVDKWPDRLLRGQDLYALILALAGIEAEALVELEADELFVGEVNFRTYQKGRWKSMLHRREFRFHLFNLEADPGEQRDVSADHPEILEAHRRRLDELSAQLQSQREVGTELSRDERRRLRALGYLK